MRTYSLRVRLPRSASILSSIVDSTITPTLTAEVMILGRPAPGLFLRLPGFASRLGFDKSGNLILFQCFCK